MSEQKRKERRQRAKRQRHLESLMDLPFRRLLIEISEMPRRKAVAVLQAMDSCTQVNCDWKMYVFSTLLRRRVDHRVAYLAWKAKQGGGS